MPQSLNKILISLLLAALAAAAVYMMSSQALFAAAAALIGFVATFIALGAEFKRQEERHLEQARQTERKRFEHALKRSHAVAPAELQAQLEHLYEQLQPLRGNIQRHGKLRPLREAIFSYLPKKLTDYYNSSDEKRAALAEDLRADLSKVDDALYTLNQQAQQQQQQRASKERAKVMHKLERLDTPDIAERKRIMHEVERNLRQLEGKARAFSPNIQTKIGTISDVLRQTLPPLLQQERQGEAVFNLRQIANTYLPDALERYSLLPAEFAQGKMLSNGKTAQATLLEQLSLLETSVQKLQSSLHHDDADSLVIHSRFLQDKFANQQLDLS